MSFSSQICFKYSFLWTVYPWNYFIAGISFLQKNGIFLMTALVTWFFHVCSVPNSGCCFKVDFWIKQFLQQLPLTLLKLHYSLKHNWRFTFQPIKEQRGLAEELAGGILGSVKFTSTANTVRHLCLSVEKPSLAEFEIQNLLITISSEKLTKRRLSSLKFCSHCRSSQKYPLPAADTCFMDPEMGLHQQSWSKKTSIRSSWSVSVLLCFGAAVHRTSGAPAKSRGKLFSNIKVGLKGPKLSCSMMSSTYWRDPIVGSWWKMPLPGAVLQPGRHGLGFTCQNPGDALDIDKDT